LQDIVRQWYINAKKYKAYIWKNKAHVLKYMACIFN